jgi:hypothetical protein
MIPYTTAADITDADWATLEAVLDAGKVTTPNDKRVLWGVTGYVTSMNNALPPLPSAPSMLPMTVFNAKEAITKLKTKAVWPPPGGWLAFIQLLLNLLSGILQPTPVPTT